MFLKLYLASAFNSSSHVDLVGPYYATAMACLILLTPNLQQQSGDIKILKLVEEYSQPGVLKRQNSALG